MFNSNNKGFSLFTALVSLLLISISLILIFNMVKTEDTYLSMIEDQSSNSDIITIADLARADAFNLFVVSLRANWETYRNSKDNTIILRRADMDKNWDSFVDNVAQSYFFERRFSQFFAQTLLNKLRYTPSVIGYDIIVNTDGNGSGTGINYTSDENALATIVESMFEKAGKKVDVVDCNQDSLDSCNGSFYLTFNTIDLNDEEYEKLPTITVKRERNNEVMQRPVLARQYYKIYMPWRGFQAMRVARRIAYSPDREISLNPADYPSSNDSGLFNPLLHNTLEQARLGVCDPGTCGPRKDFFTTSKETGFAQQCNVVFDVDGADADIKPVTASLSIVTPKVSYKLGDLTDKYKLLFDPLVKDTVKENLDNRLVDEIVFTRSLKLTTDGLAVDYENVTNPDKPIVIELINTYIDSDGTISKQATRSDDAAPAINNSFPVKVFDPSNPNSIAEAAGGLGIFYDSINGRSVYAREISSSPVYNQPYFNQTPLNQNLKCYELSSEGIQLNLVFKETNPKYSITNTEPKTYIKIVDEYTSFTFPGPALTSSISSTGYIEPLPGSMSPNGVTNLWECNSYGDPNATNGFACVSP